mmetsp:Transcript_34311/g.84159  ORF Transcript_34311/g.84159 Transcript_34311/m.84159 type:complete len:228 (+) Transcript_34311:940-1623(+)
MDDAVFESQHYGARAVDTQRATGTDAYFRPVVHQHSVDVVAATVTDTEGHAVGYGRHSAVAQCQRTVHRVDQHGASDSVDEFERSAIATDTYVRVEHGGTVGELQAVVHIHVQIAHTTSQLQRVRRHRPTTPLKYAKHTTILHAHLQRRSIAHAATTIVVAVAVAGRTEVGTVLDHDAAVGLNDEPSAHGAVAGNPKVAVTHRHANVAAEVAGNVGECGVHVQLHAT